MKLPSWFGEPVDENSPVMSDALLQAWDTLSEALSSNRLNDMTTEQLVHAVEAAAWLERVSESGRHLLVPLAKAKGASWAELARAMGVPRATAQSRHQEQVADWEDIVRQAAARASAVLPEPLARTEPPVDFDPGDDQFARHPGMQAWTYVGPLEPAIQHLRAHHREVLVYADGDAYVVSSRSGAGPGGTSTRADSEEEAWRTHLGDALARRGVLPDSARPGETLAAFVARTTQA